MSTDMLSRFDIRSALCIVFLFALTGATFLPFFEFLFFHEGSLSFSDVLGSRL